ncbi:MAG TPA: NADH-quinone oxidoreductase subunit J [Syntrophorhabdaceae bacterium]|nr:NADH-quinone oxidoreductase subunit J [Syntrophorhabdaceae bacterium]HOL05300.1 NADH-quinone oxidoreductase subunit J [Syntrophorhabdaceae bacterium]HON85739.1 NADH-quinone oxidoreductase subunit J [Syntrophorhabdaceae bacterium]HOT42087.1 NADH-quinone oxidoreductase subunit J [Syntrophorhabdaceae bacterium]HPC66042.1 NADH-quinone oxidoreductase subunit J [Syntrophorhabdaceae bacterium]
MHLADVVFIIILLITMAGALITVLSGSIIYALMGLIATMFGIAGMYVYLNAPFIAMMQILIYVGAISILIAFAIMLAGPMFKRPKEWTKPVKFISGAIAAIVSFVLFFTVVMRTEWSGIKAAEANMTTKDIGRALFDRFMLPFELISLLIVVSIIGAIMLALYSRKEK